MTPADPPSNDPNCSALDRRPAQLHCRTWSAAGLRTTSAQGAAMRQARTDTSIGRRHLPRYASRSADPRDAYPRCSTDRTVPRAARLHALDLGIGAILRLDPSGAGRAAHRAWQPHVLGHIGYAIVPWKRRAAAIRDAGRSRCCCLECLAAGPRHVELTTTLTMWRSHKVILATAGGLLSASASSTFRRHGEHAVPDHPHL